MEVNTLPQYELIGQSVGRYGPALREARRHRLAWHRLHEGVMKAIEDPERRDDPRGVGRVEPRRGEREVESQGQLSFGRSLGWRGHAREEHDERERSQTDTTLHGGPPLARRPRPSFHEILESGAATRPTPRMTANPISRMGTSEEDGWRESSRTPERAPASPENSSRVNPFALTVSWVYTAEDVSLERWWISR